MKGFPSTVVLHASAGASALSSIAWLRKIGLSYHYIIARDGTIYKLVPVGPPKCRVAYHAGKSIGPQGSGCNEYSIGICFANRNDGEKVTPEQETATRQLILSLNQTFELKWITTHRLVSWGRKTDPKGFDLLSLAKDVGLKPWRQSSKHSWV